jgi:hypothetical protein
MVNKTRKNKHKSKEGIQSIPELRRCFEHIEDYTFKGVKSGIPKEKLLKDFQKEWKKVFHKELDNKSADAYIDHLLKSPQNRRKTHKKKGGAQPISGAPLDYTTRAGLYTEPGAIPPNAYGNILEYVSKGFWNPEQSHSYDPVPGQTHYVTSTPQGMGDNTVHFKGGKRATRKLRKGGMRLIPSSVPAGILQDAQDSMLGRELGSSPDQTQRHPYYLANLTK